MDDTFDHRKVNCAQCSTYVDVIEPHVGLDPPGLLLLDPPSSQCSVLLGVLLVPAAHLVHLVDALQICKQGNRGNL